VNVLLTSVGIRNVLVEYFKREVEREGGRVFAADYDRNAPALYEADGAFIVPAVSDDNYTKSITRICRENDVKVVVSLIDTELPILARNKMKFQKNGVLCVVSEPEVIDTCQDKYKMHIFLLDSGFLSPVTFVDIEQAGNAITREEISFPLVIKPRNGSASIGIHVVDSWQELEFVTQKNKEPFIIQEFLQGDEYGLDIYTDLVTNEVISVFPKRKIRMRAGETDKAVSVKNQELMELGIRLAEAFRVVGPCDVDCFKTDRGLCVSDINPRFGGGYPLAYECGVNFMQMILRNAKGEKNPIQIGDFIENRYMLKYNAVCIKDETEMQSQVFPI